ncbi:hypothetical protein [Methylobacterium oxalidis]|nr:hypothetical protein [Methylobacterium oxalidis]
MAAIFVMGLMLIQRLQRWAEQITEGLGALLLTTALVLGAMLLCQNFPRFYANPNIPLALTAGLFSDGDGVTP